MTNLEQTQRRALHALAQIINLDRLWGAAEVDPQLLDDALDAIADYTIAVALDRMAARGCEASAEKLGAIMLPGHPRNTASPR